MALLTLLRFAFIDQFKVMSQVHQVVIFKVINRLLATITKQQRTRRRPLRNRSRNDCVVTVLAIALRAWAPRLDAGVDVETLARQAMRSKPASHRHRFVNASYTDVFKVLGTRAAQNRCLKAIRGSPQTCRWRRRGKEKLLGIVRQSNATAAFKIYDVGIQTGVILNRAKMAVEHIADLGRHRLGSRGGIV